jgi:hypothetical protein
MWLAKQAISAQSTENQSEKKGHADEALLTLSRACSSRIRSIRQITRLLASLQTKFSSTAFYTGTKHSVMCRHLSYPGIMGIRGRAARKDRELPQFTAIEIARWDQTSAVRREQDTE